MSSQPQAIERAPVTERSVIQATGRRIGLKFGRRAVFYGVLTVIALATLLPFIAMILLAVTPPGALRLPSLIPKEFTLKYLRATLSASSFVQWCINSVIYSVT